MFVNFGSPSIHIPKPPVAPSPPPPSPLTDRYSLGEGHSDPGVQRGGGGAAARAEAGYEALCHHLLPRLLPRLPLPLCLLQHRDCSCLPPGGDQGDVSGGGGGIFVAHGDPLDEYH